MLIMRLALLSCAFYLGFALALELALVLLSRWKGSAEFYFTSWGWTVFSGAIWLVSTSLAFRIVRSWIHARLVR
jgi:hypothetical protein